MTERQLQVLRALAEGDDYLTIAQSLHVSVETIRTHTKKLYRTLGARNAAHAVSLGYRSGHLGDA